VRNKWKLGNKKIILSVSDGWNERKGLRRLLNVANKAPREWKFFIIGVTRKQIKKLPNNVIGITRIWNQNELIEYYTAADAFFNPSVEETFGLVTVEAMACGTAAVVMNSTACPELILKENAGVVVNDEKSEKEQIAALKKCMEMTEARVSAEYFSIEMQINEFLNIYK
jgi:glycosyltransferase involved in cell wall biosynthesis